MRDKAWVWREIGTFPILTGTFAFLIYLGVAWFILPPDAVWSPDAGAKFLQLRSLQVENGRLAYDIQYPGHRLDPAMRFATSDPRSGLLVVIDGRLQFQRLPIFPLLSAPLFQAWGIRGLYLLPAIGGALSGVLALSLLQERDQRFAMWLLMAFGSPLYIYATLFWEHTLAVTLGLTGAWLAFRSVSVSPLVPPGVLRWLGVGFILSGSVYIRLEMVGFALALLFALWFVVREARWGTIWAGGILGLMMMFYGIVHSKVFAGQPVPGHANYLFYPFVYLAEAKWQAIPDLLIGPPAARALETGWLGILWAIAAVVVVAHSVGLDTPGKRRVRLIGLAVTAIVGTHFLFCNTAYHAAHGLLFTTPWALLGVSRAPEVWRRGDWRARVVVLTVILGLMAYTIGVVGLRASSPHGGLEWGARFAMVFYPLLALIAAWDLGGERDAVMTRALVAALVCLGLGFQVRGLSVIGHDKQINAALNQGLMHLPEQCVVSDLGWVPLNAAFIYERKQIFVTDTPEELRDWVNLAVWHQIERFIVVTLDEALVTETNSRMAGSQLEVTARWHVENLKILRVSLLSE